MCGGVVASGNSSTPVSAARGEVPDGVGLVVATLVSYVVNPLVLPPLVYGTVLTHVGASGDGVARGVGIALVFFALIPLAYVGWMRARGRIETLEIRERSKRIEPFLVVLAAGVGAFLAVLGLEMTGRRLLAALVGCHVANTALLFFVTMRWKISVHCASVAGAVATLAFARYHVPGSILGTAVVGRVVLMGGAALVPLMLWARVRSRAHTLGQAVAGTSLGLLAPYVELLVLAKSIGL